MNDSKYVCIRFLRRFFFWDDGTAVLPDVSYCSSRCCSDVPMKKLNSRKTRFDESISAFLTVVRSYWATVWEDHWTIGRIVLRPAETCKCFQRSCMVNFVIFEKKKRFYIVCILNKDELKRKLRTEFFF